MLFSLETKHKHVLQVDKLKHFCIRWFSEDHYYRAKSPPKYDQKHSRNKEAFFLHSRFSPEITGVFKSDYPRALRGDPNLVRLPTSPRPGREGLTCPRSIPFSFQRDAKASPFHTFSGGNIAVCNVYFVTNFTLRLDPNEE